MRRSEYLKQAGWRDRWMMAKNGEDWDITWVDPLTRREYTEEKAYHRQLERDIKELGGLRDLVTTLRVRNELQEESK